MRKATILVIDDEDDFQYIIRQMLEPLGYEVHPAADGLAGLEMMRRRRPDLLLLDINLPFKNGYDVCRDLREDPLLADIPVIMMTIRNRDEEIIRGLDCGADDYLTKPFESAVLAAKIARLLQKA